MDQDGAEGVEHHRLDTDLVGLDEVVEESLQADARADQPEAPIAISYLHVEPDLEFAGDHRTVDVECVGALAWSVWKNHSSRGLSGLIS